MFQGTNWQNIVLFSFINQFLLEHRQNRDSHVYYLALYEKGVWPPFVLRPLTLSWALSPAFNPVDSLTFISNRTSLTINKIFSSIHSFILHHSTLLLLLALSQFEITHLFIYYFICSSFSSLIMLSCVRSRAMAVLLVLYP